MGTAWSGAAIWAWSSRRGRDDRAATHRDRSGFSLIELLVTIAVIVVILGLLTNGVATMKAGARTTACRTNLRQLHVAAETYHLSNDAYPAAVLYVIEEGSVLTVAWDFVQSPDGEIRPGPIWAYLDGPDRVFQCPDFRGEHLRGGSLDRLQLQHDLHRRRGSLSRSPVLERYMEAWLGSLSARRAGGRPSPPLRDRPLRRRRLAGRCEQVHAGSLERGRGRSRTGPRWDAGVPAPGVHQRLLPRRARRGTRRSPTRACTPPSSCWRRSPAFHATASSPTTTAPTTPADVAADGGRRPDDRLR